ncbi:MAG: alpha-amylase family glycosyl hydrolase [Lachnospiraceae bacterium]
MKFEICTGNQENFGVTKNRDIISFSMQNKKDTLCNLLLYSKEDEECVRIPMNAAKDCGTTYTVGIQGLDWKNYCYNFEVEGKEQTDIYAKKITGRELWAEEERRPLESKSDLFMPQKVRRMLEKEEKKIELCQRTNKNKIKSEFYFSNFNWKNQEFPKIKKEDMVIYKLHARGFSMGIQMDDSRRGTISAIERKLDYLQKLGITTLLFLPIYEFEEFFMPDLQKQEKEPCNRINYWGYTTGNYFAPKSSYLGKENDPDCLKRFIQKLHSKNMECILEFYFDKKINPHLIIDILRYWKQEYHIDGFKINCENAIANWVACDGRLSNCKIFYQGFEEEFAKDSNRMGPQLFTYNEEFLYSIRKVLNHQGGTIYDFVGQMRRQQEQQGFVNFLAENNGFTLADTFSYRRKHNEENGEENKDGTDWNYSSNCGQEGITNKKAILKLRKKQIKNALAIVFLSQGIPLLWMGDESANTQEGNNNAYCQDNKIGWKDWKNGALSRQILSYTQQLSALRKAYPILRSPNPFQVSDYDNRGCPDLSYHSEDCWKMDFDRNRPFVGIFYSEKYAKTDEAVYAAYNFQNMPQQFALPKDLEWHLILDTSRENSILKVPESLGREKKVLVAEQSICFLAGTSLQKKKGIKHDTGKV